MVRRALRHVALFAFVVLLLLGIAPAAHAEGKPVLSLPTPRGETWDIIQGYNCGTHDGWGRLSFDLVNSDGRTYGAPVYAAADGTIFFYAPASGSLILAHGDGYYTMYTHLSQRIDAPTGTFVERGQKIGEVGNTHIYPTVPHLHFTFFKADGAYATNRRALELSFADGYDFPEDGSCNQYGGDVVTANGNEDTTPPTLAWSNLPAQTWLNAGRLSWTVSDDNAVAGFSQAWDHEIDDEHPHFEGALEGYLDLEIGKHVANIKAWDQAGNTATFNREIWYDPTPPSAPRANKGSQALGDQNFVVSWQASTDSVSGIKGYQLYFGSDQNGTSEWFVTEPLVDVGVKPAGTYYLRVRAQDNASNFSDWQTLGTYTVK